MKHKKNLKKIDAVIVVFLGTVVLGIGLSYLVFESQSLMSLIISTITLFN